MKMHTCQCFVRSCRAACAALAIVIMLGPVSSRAAGNATMQPAGGDGAGTIQDEDPEARAIVLRMAEFLGKAQAFSVTIDSGYDAIQDNGARIEFREKRRVTLQRPGRFRVDAQRSDGDSGLVVYDGKTLTAFKAGDNVYARLERNGTVDEVIVYMVRDLGMTLPLARMFHTGFRQSLERIVESAAIVEEDMLFEVPTTHLLVRSRDVDLQVWVAGGDSPLPRRVVMTYKNDPGQPQFQAELSNWVLEPAADDSLFAFAPPPEARQVPLLAPARRQASVPGREGGVQ